MKLLSYLLLLSTVAMAQAQSWKIRIEEPTGIYDRREEVVQVPLSQLNNLREGFRVLAPGAKPVPSQVAAGALHFPVTLIPGDPAEYTISCCEATSGPTASFVNIRRIGATRVELTNAHFRILIDLQRPAILEAYSLRAAPQKSLNLVETTPDKADPNDIHAETARFPQPEGLNPGWTSLAAKGPFTQVEILENGPVTGRLRLSGNGESWELSFTEHSPWLHWKATAGFRFASVSALPYLPFDRFVDGDESRWPGGPETSEPPDHAIQPRSWTEPPGGHFAYYRQSDNYGALGFVALDSRLRWKDAGARRFEAAAPGATEIAITFPQWRGNQTVLEARREARCLRQPLLASVVKTPAASLRPDLPALQSEAPSLSLDGEWQLAWGEKGSGPTSDWRKVNVPGSAHVQWLPASEIYTTAANWVSAKEWWYRRTFRVPQPLRAKRLALHFEATDYYADTYLNGVLIGRHEGYIDPYEYDLTGLLKLDEDNELRVRVWTPVHYYWRHRPYTIKGSYGGVDQKPDDITALGITRSVRLVARGPVRLSTVAINTTLNDDGSAAIDAPTVTDPPGSACEATLTPRGFTGPAPLRYSGPCDRIRFHVTQPRLWWTWDQGKPDLYSLSIQTADAGDRTSLAVGIREIERIGDQFYLNRRRVFLRGTNSYYHLFLSEMKRPDTARDLDLMLRMNVNIIRLHCHFNNRELYELADEKGVMIWQDFLEAWYPQDTRFSPRAAALYDRHILYVRNHPSVAAWAPSDEEDLENYRDLSKHLIARLAFLDPQRRPAVRSTGRWQDAHLYNGWYGGSIWDYARMTDSLVTEFGATALPARESLDKFLPGKWPIADHAAEWRFHKLQIGEAFKAWGDPKGLSLDEYIPRTQAYAARLFQLALERSRRRKEEGAGGIFHFFSIDIWPSVTMAAYDFYRVPTKVVDTVRRSFEPVLATIEYDRDQYRPGETVRFPLWAVNDMPRPVKGTIQWEGGQVAIDLPQDSARKVGVVEWKAARPGQARLELVVTGTDGQKISTNLYEFEVK